MERGRGKSSGKWEGRWELRARPQGALGTFPCLPHSQPRSWFPGRSSQRWNSKASKMGVCAWGCQGCPLPQRPSLGFFTPAWKGGCLSRGLGEMEARWTMCCLPTPHHELAPVPPLQARDCGGGTASPLRAFVSIRKRIPFLKTLYFQLPENCHNKYTNWPHL